MPKKKGGKKGKKGKGKAKAEPVYTTPIILDEREKMFCPRMGDSYKRKMQVDEILEEVAFKTLIKCMQKKLTHCNLAKMRLAQLPSEFDQMIPDLQALTELNLARNNLFEPTPIFDLLCQLRNLKILNMSENYLNGALPATIGAMEVLEELYLGTNQITSLPAEIGNLTTLKTINVSENSITILPEEVKNWKAIRSVNFRNNKIKSIEGFFESWKEIEIVKFGCNLIDIVPDDISSLTMMRVLDLSQNAIKEIPDSMAMCEKLETLSLGQNKISSMPSDVLCMLTGLTDLQLYKNKITDVPPEIGNLTKLERLSLASNNVKSLPEEIGACTSLKELYMSNNAKFSNIPGSAGHLRRLQELVCRKCPALKQLPTTIDELTSLRELDVRAAKKQVCKLTPELADQFKKAGCQVRGGVVKKGKKGKK